MCFLNIEANSSAVIVLFIVIYLINLVNLFTITRTKLKAVSSPALKGRSVIKSIVISFYSPRG